MHRRRRRKTEFAALGREIHRLVRDRRPKREIGVLEVRKELAQGARVDDGARQRVLAECFRLLEHTDIELGVVGFGELRELDRTGETRRAGAHDEDIELHAVARTFGTVLEDQLVQCQRRLVLRRHELPLSHAVSESLPSTAAPPRTDLPPRRSRQP